MTTSERRTDHLAGATEPGRRLAYDPALDGLRAVAVLAVMAYHAGVGAARGGFLGVDLFFVLSGFLITTLLLREQAATGRIDLAAFWARRARRLLPALVLVVVWVVVHARWIEPRVGVRSDAIATLAYVANWWQIVEDTSYFASFEAAGPLLHTWSLAIEEQWYVVWPLAVWAWLAFAGPYRRRAAALVVASLALASATAMSLLAGGSDPSRAYYGTDTRAQTLLVGALLAVLLGPEGSFGSSSSQALRRGATLVGGGALAAFLAMVGLVGDADRWMYHGGFLLAAVLAALAVLGVRANPGGAVTRALGTRHLAAVGRISYGLYLWHWPVYVIVEPGRVGVDGWALLALRVAITFAVAWASYHAIEMPIRSARPRRMAVPAGLAGATAVAVVGALALAPVAGGLSAGDQIRIAAALPAAGVAPDAAGSPEVPAPSQDEPVAVASASGRAGGPTAPVAPVAPRVGTRTWLDDPRPAAEPASVLIVGDSVFAQLLRISDSIPSIARFTVSADVRLGCGTVTDDRNPKCAGRLDSWRASTKADRPDVVLTGLSTWDAGDYEFDGEQVEFGTARHEQLLRAAWTENIDALTVTGAQLVIVGLPCVEGHSTPDDATRSQRTEPARTARVNEIVRDLVEAGPHRDVTWLDPRPLTCPSGSFEPTIGDITLFFDGIHFTDDGLELMWDWLAVRLDRVLRS